MDEFILWAKKMLKGKVVYTVQTVCEMWGQGPAYGPVGSVEGGTMTLQEFTNI